MKSELIIHDKVKYASGGIVEVKVWCVPRTEDKPHGFKYSLVYIVDGVRVIGFDNAEGKGDHRHNRDRERPYRFISVKKLVEDFYREVNSYED